MTKNSTIFLNAIILSSLSLSMTSCNDAKSAKRSNSLSQASLLEEEGKADEAAEMYSSIGEILLKSPEGVIHAQTMFKKSLALNSSDSKANIYSAIISPLLTAKGYIARLPEPQDEEGKAELKAIKDKIKKTNVKEFIDFALTPAKGKTSIANTEDQRKFIRNEYVKELDASLVKLNNVKAEKTVLSYLDLSAKRSKSSEISGPLTDEEINRKVEQNSLVSNKQIVVDTYDLKALKIILKTQKNALTIATSFGFTGYEEIAEKLQNTPAATDKQVVAAIKSQPKFLKIDGSKSDLHDIFNHTEEVMNDLIDFSKISKELCGNPSRSENLISEVCVTEDIADKISETLMYVVGPKAVLLGYDANNEEVLVEVNLRALLDSNVSSLQELFPTKFDSKGKAIDIKDKTFAGIIPNADLISKYKTVVK